MRYQEAKRVWHTSCSDPITAIFKSRKGQIGICTSREVLLYNDVVPFSEEQRLQPGRVITAAAFSHEGDEIITGDNKGVLSWWSCNNGAESCSTPLSEHEQQEEGESVAETPFPVVVVSCSPQFVAAACDRTVSIHGHDHQLLHTIAMPDSILEIFWLDSQHLVSRSVSEILEWHIEEQKYKCLAKYACGNDKAQLTAMACNAATMQLAAATRNGLVFLWQIDISHGDLQNPSVPERHPVMELTDAADHKIVQLCWGSKGAVLAAASTSQVVLWSISKGTQDMQSHGKIFHMPKGWRLTALSFQENETLLSIGAHNGRFIILDSTTLESSDTDLDKASQVEGNACPDSEEACEVAGLSWHSGAMVLAADAKGRLSAHKLIESNVCHAATSHSEETPETRPAPAGNSSKQKSSKVASNWSEESNGATGSSSNGIHENGNAYGQVGRTPRGAKPARNKQALLNSMQQLRIPDTISPPPSHLMSPDGQIMGAWPVMPAMSAVRWPMQPMPYLYSPFMPAQSVPGHPQNALTSLVPTAQHGSPVLSASGQNGPLGVASRGPAGSRPLSSPLPMQLPMYMYGQPGVQWPMLYAQQWAPAASFYGQSAHPLLHQAQYAAAGASPAGVVGNHAAPPEARPSMGGGASMSSFDRLSSKSRDSSGSGKAAASAVDASNTGNEDAVVTLYAGNLAPAVDENVLLMHFMQFGPIAHVQVIRDRPSGRSRGFGFVTYSHHMYAAAAMRHMNGAMLAGPFEGRPIKVSPSNKR